MRQETRKIAEALKAGRACKMARTETDGHKVWLHGNLIAQRSDSGMLALTLSGWNTRTTRERLNGIAQTFGLNVRFYQKDGICRVHDSLSDLYGYDATVGDRTVLYYSL